MKCIAVLMLVGIMQVSANVYSQSETVSLKMEDASLISIMKEITKLTGYDFLYNYDLLSSKKKMDIDVVDTKLSDVLNNVFSKRGLEYNLRDKVIVIKEYREKTSLQQAIAIKGVVKDEQGNPIPGVTVVVKGTSLGISTDLDGKFEIDVPKDKDVLLVFSFIGMESQTVKAKDGKFLNICMKDKKESLNEVVVNGFFKRDKNTFTGAAKTISGDEIKELGTPNIIKCLAILDPAVVIKENNVQGSNPNAIPEIIIRGTTSINTGTEMGINAPLIVIDGIESSLTALYDMDIYDIESVSVLKDASATALYGERAANGVILVNRKKTTSRDVRFSYNLMTKFDFPDLSDYNLMNAREKLEFEKLSGIYDSRSGINDPVYNEKLARVNSGVDTDWIAKPLRTGFSQTHSGRLSGRSGGMSYGITLRYSDTQGVMKDDYRKNIGAGAHFTYNYKRKLITSFRLNYTQNNVRYSKYGTFDQYVKRNPYDTPYNEKGELRPQLSASEMNPLYEASLSSFSKNIKRNFSGNISLRYNMLPCLHFDASANVSTDISRSDNFTSPKSFMYSNITDSSQKGTYFLTNDEGYNYYVKIGANFHTNLDDLGSMLSVNIGGDIRKYNDNSYSLQTQGFFNERLSDFAHVLGYRPGTSPDGRSVETARAGGYFSYNLVYRNRYFMDGSYRLSGSSSFGKNQRYAPFWSTGIGWNLHRESFLDYDWIDILRVRASYGQTGSINFPAYMAITTYKYSKSLIYKYGNGASPMAMGNEDLKWQTTKSINLGITANMFRNRLNIDLNYYVNRTVDMIVPVYLSPSVGETQVRINLGQQDNTGFECSLSGVVLRNKTTNWRINLSTQFNRNELVNIGNALASQNKTMAANNNSIYPSRLFVEGESTSQLYVVRSAGIDPATGKELFITKDGTITYYYNPEDKVAFGEKDPKIRGSLSSFYTYKNWTLNISGFYSFGGYIYNGTRAERIERIDPKYNADRRAFTQRWKKPGDVVEYATIINAYSGDAPNQHTSRFVEKENYISIGSINLTYQFNSKMLKRCGFSKCNLSFSANEIARFSTIRQERGTGYPFARSFSFTISPTF